MEYESSLLARVCAVVLRNPFVSVLVASCGKKQPQEPPVWVKLFERHPEDEVTNVDTTWVVCQALYFIFQLHMQGDRRRPLSYFTSFPGSGKSRLCGKVAEMVYLLRSGDPAAAAAMEQHIPEQSAATIGWAARAYVIGVNFNRSSWALSDEDKALSEFGLLVPLYLRIIFFMQAQLDGQHASLKWMNLCASCRVLLTCGLINETSLFKAVCDLIKGLVGASSPFQPLIIIVDELHKVQDFFSPNTADKYRSAICRLTDMVGGSTLFSSLGAHLMLNEKTASGRPVRHLPCMLVVPTPAVFQAVLESNAQRGVYLNYDGVMADWVLDDASPAGQLNLELGVSALAFLVGDDVRFATFLARQLLDGKVGDGGIHSLVKEAAVRTSFSHGMLWGQQYGPTVLAHVILEWSVSFDHRLTDKNRAPLDVDWDAVRLRGHVQAVGGEDMEPKLPAYALWHFFRTRAQRDDHGIYNGVRQLLTWTNGSLLWHGCEEFFLGCILTLDSARALIWPEQECSLAALYPSSTHTGSDAIVADEVLGATRPRYGVRTARLPLLIDYLTSGDGPHYDFVWRLNQNAFAMDAAVFYTHEDGEPAMVCVQIKFSSQDSSNNVSWKDSCKWISAMETACAAQAGADWSRVRGRVAFLVMARRRRGPSYEADKAAHPRAVMNKAIVLCWEDMHTCLGSFLSGLLEHAETLFGAEIVKDDV